MNKKSVFVVFQVAILGLAVSCIADDRVPCKEYPFTERPVVTSIDGEWIGNAISYGPFREGHEPGGESPSKEQIREDLHILSDHWRLLRLYGVNQCAREVLEVVREDGLPLKVMIGVWLYPESSEEGVADTSAEELRRDIAEAVALAKEFPEVVWAISVGNESQVSWSGHRVPLERLIRCIRDVRGKTCVPVTTADDFEFWLDDASHAVADEIDFVVMHAHPVWHGMEAEDALVFVRECYSTVSEKHPDKLVVIGETGWATDKDPEGRERERVTGKMGEEEQLLACSELVHWAKSHQVPLFLFEAFDEHWKGDPGPREVEKHWGLFKIDRTPKLFIEQLAEKQ